MCLTCTESPVRRRYLVTSCGIPVLLDQSGGLRNSCQALELITFRAVDTCNIASVIETRPVLARDPASLSEDFREGNGFRLWGYRLTGSYAAVPANGPAANESQPLPLAGLRCSAANRGPNNRDGVSRGS
jgi:hypothetical protein